MKIIILGFGKVGLEIQNVCDKNGILVKAVVSPNNPLERHKNIYDAPLQRGDVVIDFSHPDAVLNNVEVIAPFGGNIVMGTTGWEKDEDKIRNIVSHSNIGFAFTPNYLPEVHAFWDEVKNFVSSVELGSEKYSAKVFEERLFTKKSSSGTAKKTAEILFEKQNIDFDMKNDFLCSFMGTKALDIHVDFSSAAESFSLQYESKNPNRNNRIYATMAIKTAFWLQHKKGFYELSTQAIQEIQSILLREEGQFETF